MANLQDMEKFKTLLDEEYDWPVDYLFKFILPIGQRELFINSLGIEGHIERPSKTGKYISITFHKNVTSSDDVLFVYEQASQVKGVMSL